MQLRAAENRETTASPPRSAGPALDVRIEQALVQERRRAARTLLQHPLLTAQGPLAEQFALVRRHATWLRDWFHTHTGWTLQMGSELVRLRKTPPDLDDPTRPARDTKNHAVFSRRCYVLLCLALAALERSDRQTALGRLADEVASLIVADPALGEAGIRFDLGRQDQRRDLVQVIRLLLQMRVLVRVHGDEQQYVSGKGDVLYTINRPALAAMLNVRRGPSTVEAESFQQRIAAVVEEPLPDTDEGRNRRLRLRLMRRLLDDPVLYYDQLDDDERAYLTSQRGRLLRHIQEATGLVPEVRREGIALVDADGDLTDLGMPEEGTDGHLALLLAEYLADHARRNPDLPLGLAALHEQVARLIAGHRSHWRRSVGEPGAEVPLTAQTLDRLEALRLVRQTADGVLPLPAIARYALKAPGNGPAGPPAAPPPSQTSLWNS